MKITLTIPDKTFALSVVIVWDEAKSPYEQRLVMSGVQAGGSELYNGQKIILPEPEEADDE